MATNRIFSACLVALVGFISGQALYARPFNLAGPEIVKLDWNTRSLFSHDIDQDGMTDIAVINNDQSKIILLYQSDSANPDSGKRRSVKQNRWEPVLEDSRFVKDSIVCSQYMYALTVGDLNGDNRPDIVYTGNNDPLTVLFQGDDGSWSDSWTYDNMEPLQWISTLSIADMDNDGSGDLVVLAKEKILIFHQEDSGKMSDPSVYRLSEKNPYGLRLIDLNGDDRTDLIYLSSGKKNALRVRMQYETGGFGPELGFRLDISFSSIRPQVIPDGDGVGFAYINSKTGHMEVFVLKPEDRDTASLETLQPRNYPSGVGGRSAALYALGDYDGDGLIDIAVGDVEGAQVLLHLQNSHGDFSEPVAFPSLANLSGMASGDFFDEGQDSLIVMSEKEGIAGISRLLDGGRLSFPESIAIVGKPVTAVSGDVDNDGQNELITIEKIDKKYSLVVLDPSAKNGDWSTTNRIALEELRRKPSALFIATLNSDHLNDIVVLIPREPARLFLQNATGEFTEVATDSAIRKSLLMDIDLAQIGSGDVDGDGHEEILVAGAGFARSLRIDEHGNLEIIDQYNARNREAELTGPLVLDIDGDGINDLIFHDKESRALQVFRRDQYGVYRPEKLIEVDEIDLAFSRLVQLGPKQEPRLMYFSKNRFWLIPLDRGGWEIDIVSSYETDLINVNYSGIASGDLNGDSISDILVMDGKKHLLEVLDRNEDNEWASAIHFTVFDENLHYQGRRGAPLEPREIMISDLTNDTFKDITILVHDRILLYYQQ